MTLKQLEALYWAATLGSFAIAAERLHISQSSLSKRIGELEASLGTPLFDRSARRASLTPEAESILADVKHMLDTETGLRGRLRTGNAIRGTLRMGIGELAVGTWFPGLMTRASTEFPDLLIEPMVSLGRTMERLVERGSLDCAVIAGRATLATLAEQPLSSVEFDWMASAKLGLRRKEVTAEALERYPVIGLTSTSGHAQAFEDWVTASGGRIERMITCNSTHAIVELTVAGIGLTVLPRRYLAPLVRRGLLVRLKSTPKVPPLEYTFIARHDDTRPLIGAVRDMVVKHADFTRSTPLWDG